MQNSLNQDVNLNQSFDFDIDPPEVGNVLIQKQGDVNTAEQAKIPKRPEQIKYQSK